MRRPHQFIKFGDDAMTLCDHLEMSLRTGEERRHGLLKAILRDALLPASEDDKAA